MLYTRCPDCKTTFRITAEALSKAGGQVRCGRCACVFDAYAELRERQGDADVETGTHPVAAPDGEPGTDPGDRSETPPAAAEPDEAEPFGPRQPDDGQDRSNDSRSRSDNQGQPDDDAFDGVTVADVMAGIESVAEDVDDEPAGTAEHGFAGTAEGVDEAAGTAAAAGEPGTDMDRAADRHDSDAHPVAKHQTPGAPEDAASVAAAALKRAAAPYRAADADRSAAANRNAGAKHDDIARFGAKHVDAKRADARHADAKRAGPKAADLKGADLKAADPKAAEPKVADPKSVGAAKAGSSPHGGAKHGAKSGSNAAVAEPGEENESAAASEWHLASRAPASRRSKTWLAASIVAALTLALQVTHFFRAEIAGAAIVGPLLQDAYALIGANVTPRWDVEQYRVVDWVAAAEPGPDGRGSLKIAARIRNQGPNPQPYPHVHVQLMDRWDAAVGSRVFAPAEYLPPGTRTDRLMTPGATARAELDVVDPGPDAYGFELDVCVESGADRLRCSADPVFQGQ